MIICQYCSGEFTIPPPERLESRYVDCPNCNAQFEIELRFRKIKPLLFLVMFASLTNLALSLTRGSIAAAFVAIGVMALFTLRYLDRWEEAHPRLKPWSDSPQFKKGG